MKVLLSIPNMPTISFKADDEFKKKLNWLAKHNGINVSAYIKLLLTKSLKKELSEVTENGFTVAEEMRILEESKDKNFSGSFNGVNELMNHLNNQDEDNH